MVCYGRRRRHRRNNRTLHAADHYVSVRFQVVLHRLLHPGLITIKSNVGLYKAKDKKDRYR